MYGIGYERVACPVPSFFVLPCLFWLKINLEVTEKSVPLQSQMKNGWLLRLGVLCETDA